ncbi:MAG: hypothetical protein ACO26H_02235 [Sediminibacterium sp.]
MTYLIVNDYDGNDSFEIEASSPAQAAHLALQELGWWVAEAEESEDEETNITE